ncbi:MAG: hypothetical protein RJA81_621, partial [Planctomycetota bacterium]
QRPHRIVRLEDTNGDGRFDKSIVFADKMMFPEGTLWHRGSLYVSAPPSIWKLTDTDGDGVADQRTEWFQGKTLTGCANDLHGPYLGRDGRIYWAKGAFAEQTHQIHGREWKSSASHFFRMTEDGRHLEPVMTGGMDNPVDMVFTPGGERIFSCTFLTQPSVGQRDGLIHAIYGGIYGKTNGKTQEPQHKWTGPDLMPVLSHLGPAAACGLTDYESDHFGPEFRNNIFSSSFNLRKISRHELINTTSAGLSSRDSDFLVCDDIDFHPTDVFTDADGSLIVVDTGGWYKLCCPTSQIIKADVLGAVYRVRKTGGPVSQDPRGLDLKWKGIATDQLTERLDDSRFAVRDRAIDLLAGQGSNAIEALKNAFLARDSSSNRRLNVIWTATRIESPAAMALVRLGLNDSDPNVRQAAVHSVALHRDVQALNQLLEMLTDSNQPASIRRAVAEALGRLQKPDAVATIMKVAGQVHQDRVMQHSLTYALIEIDSAAAIYGSLKSEKQAMGRLVGMIALDQMGVSDLPVPELIQLMDSSDPEIRNLSAWIVSRHPEWAGQLVADFREKISDPPTDKDRLAALIYRLARFAAGSTEIQNLLAETLTHGKKASVQTAIQAMSGSGLKSCPAQWESSLKNVFSKVDAEMVQNILQVFRTLNPADSSVAAERFAFLISQSADPKFDRDLQWSILASVPAGSHSLSPEIFQRITDRLNAQNPSLTRLAAVDLMLRVKLSSDQRQTIAQMAVDMGPMELQKIMAMFDGTTDTAAADQLMLSLEKTKALSAIPAEALSKVVAKLGEPQKNQMNLILRKRDKDLIAQRQHVENLLTSFPAGDVRRGQAVFNGAKAACRSCHSVGYVGGKVGPDLSRIGQIRTQRDLLEAIVFPSLSFVRSYEPVTVALQDGRVFSGILQSENTESLTLVINATESQNIPKADIEEITPSTVSVMPAGLDKQLTTQELADLITYLMSSR